MTVVVPFAAGGGSDLLARLVTQKLEARLPKAFIVENRPGAGTTLAAMQVVRAAPDGYTLMQGTSSTMAINVTDEQEAALRAAEGPGAGRAAVVVAVLSGRFRRLAAQDRWPT